MLLVCMNTISKFLEFLNRQKLCIVLVPHLNPDADAMGASLGFAQYLEKNGHTATVLCPNKYPGFLSWLPGIERTLVYSASCMKCRKLLEQAEHIIFIDLSSFTRTGDLEAPLRAHKAPKALIDHHPHVEDMASYRVWSSRAAATSQLIYDIIQKDHGEHSIDSSIATCLYAGILTDTGAFRFSSTTSRVHHIIARLIQLGQLKVQNISERLYSNYSENRLRFLGHAFSKCLTVLPNDHAAFFTLTQESMRAFQIHRGDTEGLVNYALSIEGVYLAALIKEQKEGVRLSFRSKGVFSVSELARTYFNGGGHRNAAGGTSTDSIDRVVEQFKQILPKYKSEILTSNQEM